MDRDRVRRDIINALTHSSMLRFIGKEGGQSEQFRKMLEQAEVVHFRTGNAIIREGKQSDSMFFLVSGKVKVSHHGRTLCSLMRTGDVFGEIGPATGNIRSATVTALCPVTCLQLRFPPENTGGKDNVLFLGLVYQALTHVLSERLRDTNEEMVRMMGELNANRKELEHLKQHNEHLRRENESLRALDLYRSYGHDPEH